MIAKLRTVAVIDWDHTATGEYNGTRKSIDGHEYTAKVWFNANGEWWRWCLTFVGEMIAMGETKSRDGAFKATWYALDKAIGLREPRL